MRQFDRMTSGKLYDPSDKELLEMRANVRELVKVYNDTAPSDTAKREELLCKILGSMGKNACMEPNIRFDYGCNTTVGNNFFANFDCTILDVAPVIIGDNVMFGCNVTIATPTHPLVASQRRIRLRPDGSVYDLEAGKTVVIEDDVWLASNVVVTGGVTIGKGAVIGANSVVTRDIPPNVIAVGNPCRPIREITDKDIIDESDLI